MMVLNRAAESLDRDSTRITILTAEGQSEQCPVLDKNAAADHIMQRIATALSYTE